MAYPDDIDKFNDKLNKIEGNTYVIEEKVDLVNGSYESELQHDNISVSSLNVYTGEKLTGNKVDTYTLSTPSTTPWKKIIKIYSSVTPLYISYETTGDTVEADDINKVQCSITNIENEVDRYKDSNNTRVLNDETRIKTVEDNKSEKTYVDTELLKKSDKADTYTKSETDQRIQMVVNAAPSALDTLKEIADALNDDPNFAVTITTELSKKVDKIEGKQLSTEDYTTTEKNKLAGIQDNANNYVHPSMHPAAMITEDSNHRWSTDTEKSNWNDANSKKHTHGNLSLLETITQTLIDTWNTVSNKVDKITGKGLSTNDFDNTYKAKLDGTSTGANKTNSSITNGNIQIDGKETVVYTHPGSGTNPHGTTKSDVGLGNVTNDAQVKRSEMGVASGVATLDSSGVNAQAPKSHTHDDRYYTETECDTKYATKSEISQAGYGDMLKSVYDTNNNGIVDKAEDSNTVDGKNASDFAPSGYGLGGISARLNSPDLNNVISNGWYDCQTPTNYVPDIGSNWHKLLVIASADTNYVTQIAFSMVNQTSGSAWIREKRAGTWGNWIRILTSSKQCSWNDLKGV